jgi:gamma-glutamyl hydrolase
VIGIVT